MKGIVRYEYDRTKDICKFTAWLGHRFTSILHKSGYTRSKQKYLFAHIGMAGFSVHKFFIPDIKQILLHILDTGSQFDVNFKAIENIVKIIDNDIMVSHGKLSPLDMNIINNDMRYPPLPVQKPVYENYINIRNTNMSRGMLLDGPVGIGKTYMSLSIALALKSEVTLIVAPLATIDKVWSNSLSGDGVLFNNPQSHYIVGSDTDYRGEKYVLCHYENIGKIMDLYSKYNINFTMLIVDEIHNFTDMKSNRTKLLIDITDKIPFKDTLPMSGTPIKAGYKDLVAILKIVYSDFSTTVMNRYIKLYRGSSWLMKEVLKDKYRGVSTVLKKTDMKIPPLTTTNVKIKIKNGGKYTLAAIRRRLIDYVETRQRELDDNYDTYSEQYTRLYTKAKDILLETGKVSVDKFKWYERTVKLIVGAHNNNSLMSVANDIREVNVFEKTYIISVLNSTDSNIFKDVKSIYKYSSLKVRGEALANVVMRSRIDCYSEMATAADILEFVNSTTNKTIIFSNYTDVCESVRQSCLSRKLKPITVYGDTSKDLNKNVNIFSSVSNINPLIATYKSLSTGVPLIAANVVVLFGLPHRQYIFEQAIGRAWRTGQTLPVSVYITELNTGDDPNITDRDVDIIDFFRNEVSAITGKEDSVTLDRGMLEGFGPELTDTMSPVDTFITKSMKITSDIIDKWK